MKYQEILDQVEEVQHVRALMSARGAEPGDEVDEAFFDVLEEEGYQIEMGHCAPFSR